MDGDGSFSIPVFTLSLPLKFHISFSFHPITMMPATMTKHLSYLSPPPPPPPLHSFPPLSSLLLPSPLPLFPRPPSLRSAATITRAPDKHLQVAFMSAFTASAPPLHGFSPSSSSCPCFRADRELPSDSAAEDGEGDEDDDDEEGDLAFHVIRNGSTSESPSSLPDRWDVLGLGQAMVGSLSASPQPHPPTHTHNFSQSFLCLYSFLLSR